MRLRCYFQYDSNNHKGRDEQLSLKCKEDAEVSNPHFRTSDVDDNLYNDVPGPGKSLIMYDIADETLQCC